MNDIDDMKRILALFENENRSIDKVESVPLEKSNVIKTVFEDNLNYQNLIERLSHLIFNWETHNYLREGSFEYNNGMAEGLAKAANDLRSAIIKFGV